MVDAVLMADLDRARCKDLLKKKKATAQHPWQAVAVKELAKRRHMEEERAAVTAAEQSPLRSAGIS